MTVSEIMRDAEALSLLVADAVIRRTNPAQDDISERAARQAYGRSWLNRAKRSGLVSVREVGNRVYYSRHQLNCLREAEKVKNLE